jgi:hypothetical protein
MLCSPFRRALGEVYPPRNALDPAHSRSLSSLRGCECLGSMKSCDIKTKGVAIVNLSVEVMAGPVQHKLRILDSLLYKQK